LEEYAVTETMDMVTLMVGRGMKITPRPKRQIIAKILITPSGSSVLNYLTGNRGEQARRIAGRRPGSKSRKCKQILLLVGIPGPVFSGHLLCPSLKTEAAKPYPLMSAIRR